MSLPILFFSYGTRASKVLWLAKTLAVELELRLVSLQSGEQRAKEYLAKNPHGTVPTLELPDGQILFESGAIIMYLLENYDKDNKLTGAPGTFRRNQFLNFNALAAETEAVVIGYFLHTVLYPPQMQNKAVAEDSKHKWNNKLRDIYVRLLEGKEKKFADGSDDFSALDVVVGYSLNIANRSGLLTDSPRLKEYADFVISHPHFAASHVQPK